MLSFYRLGQVHFPVVLLGASIEEFSIIVHSESAIANHASVTDLRAAREMQKYIALITGISVPVVSDFYPLEKKYEILIGSTNRKQSLCIDEDFSHDGYAVVSREGKLVLRGGKRGIIYAVYAFLEEYCGVRFFTEDVEKIINRGEIVIANVDTRFSPVLTYREMSFWNAWDTEFSVKSRLNGLMIRKLPTEWGGGVGFVGGPKGLVHTFSHLLPPVSYFYSHPEYFALNAEGKRDPSGICFSNEQTFSIVVNNALSWLSEQPDGIISLSINDGDVAYCGCKQCKSATDEEGGLAGGVLRFVNKVAAEIEKTYPNAHIETLIYGKVEHLPKHVRPAHNVMLRVSSSFTRSHSLLDYKKYDEARDNIDLNRADKKIRSWSSICDSMIIWDYPAPYICVNSVFPQFHTIVGYFKYFINHKSKGIYVNGNGGKSCSFAELTVYLISKALWNPNMSQQEYERHMDEFLCGYYGSGWRHIRDFIDYTRDMTKGRIFTAKSKPADIIPPDDAVIAKMRQCFKDAEATTTYLCEKHRIQRASLQVDYYELYATMDQKWEESNSEQRHELEKKNRKLYDNLKKHGILRVKENTFLLKITDFSQSPVIWEYWDAECLAGERNNGNYDKDLYVLIPVDAALGSAVDAEFLFKTSSVNKKCTAETLSVDGDVSFVTDSHDNTASLMWDSFRDYKTLYIKNALITNVKDYARHEGKSEQDKDFALLPIHKKGIILKIRNVSAGAYCMIKELSVVGIKKQDDV